MSKVGFLIPEFPGQTHAFFNRERDELLSRGIETQIISTRPPVQGAGAANHEWAQKLARETIYLSPMGVSDFCLSLWAFLISGPVAWFRCIRQALLDSDLNFTGKLKLFTFIIPAAQLKRICRLQGLAHVHVHSFANAANVAMFAKLLGGPTYSATLHGPLQDYGPNQLAKWKHANFAIIITKELVSEVKTQLAAVQLPPAYLAPMGVNIESFKRTTPYVPYKKGEALRLTTCGRINIVKAHDDLIRAIAMLRDENIIAYLTVCGGKDSVSDSSGYYEELISLAKELDVESQVTFLGSVSEERVRSELENAHFFCLASLREPLGVATMEAMAMEIPAIVTRSPGVEEMIDSGVDGILVSPRSPSEFVETLKSLMVSPDQACRIAKNGREKVVEKFHSGVSASKIAEGIASL